MAHYAAIVLFGGCASAAAASDCVVLLHGLARTSTSMTRMAEALEDRGFAVANIGYPSRKHDIETLSPLAVESGLTQCDASETVHFVTHSLGGILVRFYLEHNEVDNIGRVVMLAPPNQGSEVVDNYRGVPGFKLLNGPAGMQLGTDEASVPLKLGPVEFDLGVVAGNETFNPILSQSLPNPDDGKVSVERTKVEGMADFVVVEESHPFIMRAPSVIDYTISFIETGRFDQEEP
ncbi:MAG: alpha/beta fold hydrolase [Pseudomonadota bacterium]